MCARRAFSLIGFDSRLCANELPESEITNNNVSRESNIFIFIIRQSVECARKIATLLCALCFSSRLCVNSLSRKGAKKNIRRKALPNLVTYDLRQFLLSLYQRHRFGARARVFAKTAEHG